LILDTKNTNASHHKILNSLCN